MARYTEKTDADLAWSAIRREIQYRLNCAAATWKARKLNEILPPLQKEFEGSLNRGVILALPDAATWDGDLESLLGS